MSDATNTCVCDHRRRDHRIEGSPGMPLSEVRWSECEVCGCDQFDAVHGRQSTHWQGCWRAHHACAVVLLERILASDQWAAECAEFGCHDPDLSSRSVAPEEG